MSDPKSSHAHALIRRGFDLGDTSSIKADATANSSELNGAWAKGEPIVLRGIARSSISTHQHHIARSAELCERILTGESAEQVFDEPVYQARWSAQFEALGTSVNPAEQQEIETLFFDGLASDSSPNGLPDGLPDGEPIEDLWLKVSWLSFYEGDKSLRFRFSFGVDHEEDVAADPVRQHYAAELADALFPESRIITHNQDLLAKIQEYAISQSGEQRDTATARFVERIIYFNAPQGGAYLHHDLERGHAGVVYVQVSGETCWLALPKNTLLTNIQKFIQQCDHSGGWPVSFSHNFNKKERDQLTALSIDLSALDAAIESFNHSALIRLINETPEFVQALIANGHGHILKSGDAILLPQQTSPATEVQNCCWHSVFCIGDVAGEGLSFAIRTD